MTLAFLLFLSIFILIGVSSFFASRGTKADYYLASSSVHPALVGLSAVATNNSGYMFIGVIGYTYVTGLASIWLMLGWIVGDFIASCFVHSRLRHATQRTGEVSYASVLSSWGSETQPHTRRVIAIVSLVFLLAYASAQLVAGSKALHVLLGWPLWSGAVLGAVLVVLYCIAGGIRASIWTDAAQSIVMIAAMGSLLAISVLELGGLSSAIDQMYAIDGFMDWVPQDMALPGIAGGVLFIMGWLFAGFSVVGQPHVMVRFMALNDSGNMRQARCWYYLWFLMFYAMATGVGMLSRIFIADTGSFDAELALPTMAVQLLPDIMVGLVLAGIFAATLSTADSLVLSCSAAISHDLMPQTINNTKVLKIFTALITAAALLWALLNSQSVFSLVILAWSGLASAFAPLLLLMCFGRHPRQWLAITMMLVGLAVALLWRYLGLHQSLVYEGLVGILAGFMVYALLSIVAKEAPAK